MCLKATQKSASPSPLAFDAWEQDFIRFHDRFADLFARPQTREQSRKFLRALMGPIERRNGWQLAQAAGDRRPDPMQRLLYRSPWDAEEARDRLLAFQNEEIGHPHGIAIVDDTGILKQGQDSVGVQRQYSGTAGKVDNCQVAVFLAYSSPRGYGLLDRRVYLPRSWCEDLERRRRAKVPDTVEFQTKPQLGAKMIDHALHHGLPVEWVTGDETYGDDPAFRDAVARHGRRYVLAVASTTPIFSTRPKVQEPEAQGPGRRGRSRTRGRVAPGQPQHTTVAKLVGQQPSSAWQCLAVAQGDKGPIDHDWLAVRVVERRKELPGEDLWLLARRSVRDSKDIAYYLSNGEESVELSVLASIASHRFVVEQCLAEAKDDVGLDQYEVRTWPSWHRFVTLSMMALAWLGSVRRRAQDPEAKADELSPLTVPEVRRLLAVALPLPRQSVELHLLWSRWRRSRRFQSRRSHYRRRDRLRRRSQPYLPRAPAPVAAPTAKQRRL